MSCRVLKRGMEHFVLNTIVDFCKSKNYKNLIGEYIATPKNQMVENHYLNLGFAATNNLWNLKIDDYITKTTYISQK